MIDRIRYAIGTIGRANEGRIDSVHAGGGNDRAISCSLASAVIYEVIIVAVKFTRITVSCGPDTRFDRSRTPDHPTLFVARLRGL
jgi:hypothetical protein